MKSLLTKLSLILSLSLVLITTSALGQSKPVKPNAEDDLTQSQQRALLLVNQQTDEAGKLENVISRIAIMVRAGEVLWDFQQDNARKVFADAYDLAVKRFREKGEQPRTSARSNTANEPDQRFLVIAAIVKHDSEWGIRLSKQIAEETKKEAEKAAAAASDPKTLSGETSISRIGEKLISLAFSLLKTDHKTAIDLFRSTFRYPAVYSLSTFLFEVAKTDQSEADQLFREALGVYSSGNLEGTFYLSVYPFPLNRPIGPTSIGIYYQAPPGFIPNPALQQMFLSTLMQRAENSLSLADNSSALTAADINKMYGTQLPEKVQLYGAMLNLEPVVAQTQPTLMDRFQTVKNSLLAATTTDMQRKASAYSIKTELDGDDVFARMADRAENEKDPGRKNQYLAQALFQGAEKEDLARLENLGDKITEPSVREQVMDAVYFRRGHRLLKDGQLDEASRLAKKIVQVDYRANLSYDIASESLKQNNDKARAAEILNAVETEALKAPDTIEKSRTLLGIAHLFAQFDQIRAVEVIDDAVKTINQVSAKTPEPNLSQTSFSHKIEGKTFGIYSSYQVSGFSLENAFTEAAPFDFEGVLLIARKLDDKVLRAHAIIAISAGYLKPKNKTTEF